MSSQLKTLYVVGATTASYICEQLVESDLVDTSQGDSLIGSY